MHRRLKSYIPPSNQLQGHTLTCNLHGELITSFLTPQNASFSQDLVFKTEESAKLTIKKIFREFRFSVNWTEADEKLRKKKRTLWHRA